MIRKHALEILDSDDLTIGNYFDCTEISFLLNGFNEVLGKANNECIRIVMLDKATEGL